MNEGPGGIVKSKEDASGEKIKELEGQLDELRNRFARIYEHRKAEEQRIRQEGLTQNSEAGKASQAEFFKMLQDSTKEGNAISERMDGIRREINRIEDQKKVDAEKSLDDQKIEKPKESPEKVAEGQINKIDKTSTKKASWRDKIANGLRRFLGR